VQNFLTTPRSNVVRFKGQDGHGFVRGEDELDLVCGAIIVHMHHGSDVAAGQAVLRDVSLEDGEFQLIHVGDLRGYAVTNLAPPPSESTIQTVRTDPIKPWPCPDSAAILAPMREEFEWDRTKERLNRLRHGVAFDEATTVFEDPSALTVADDPHSQEEDRYIVIGLSAARRILVVCHTFRGDAVRLISARRATPRERRHYETSR
jgi:uncharacterized protein